MKAVIQRVSRASVSVEQLPVGSIGVGMLIFVCAEPNDGAKVIRKFVDKVLKLRIFADDDGKMNRNIVNIDGKGQCGGLLIVSQFTLAADLRAGNRPSFTAAAPPEHARSCYEALLAYAKSQHPIVQSGSFGADMKVELINDGPASFLMDLGET